ncbi:unnamed protein product [Cuscuta epithymum]|uniref:Uncharacterized protein n=1 Tax=Cuscuta epithymum TaxID=186058 RepID=A0AAV0F626_9ASTE|nr:unnamed protein product [Cuscuta epithymum]
MLYLLRNQPKVWN